MRLRAWLADVSSTDVLRRVQFSVCALVCGLAVWWGFRYISQSLVAKNAKVSAETSMKAIADVRKTLNDASRLTIAEPLPGMQAIGAFQNALERTTAEHSCELVEFQASPDMAPFLTRFKKITEKNDWLQIEARLSLKGRLADVVTTLATLAQLDLPFEFNSITLVREEGAKFGESGVSAKVELRVLTKSAGEKA
jgi:hypothetical protein